MVSNATAFSDTLSVEGVPNTYQTVSADSPPEISTKGSKGCKPEGLLDIVLLTSEAAVLEGTGRSDFTVTPTDPKIPVGPLGSNDLERSRRALHAKRIRREWYMKNREEHKARALERYYENHEENKEKTRLKAQERKARLLALERENAQLKTLVGNREPTIVSV